VLVCHKGHLCNSVNKLNGMCLPEENLLGVLLQMVSNVEFCAKCILGWLEVC